MTGANPVEPSLMDLIVSAPLLARPEVAKQRIGEWLAGLPGPRRLVQTLALPKVLALMSAVADHSPFLWRLAVADPQRLDDLLHHSPGAALADCLERLDRDCAASGNTAQAMTALRRARATTALLVALADLGGVWQFEEVVASLTRFADSAVSAALAFLLREAARNGKLSADPDHVQRGSGMALLALGKHGARELNFSSDIDVVVLFDPTASALAGNAAPSSFYVRLTQQFVRMLGERTADGYVLRVDLRLRPDPASTAVAISVPAALSYYETLGQNWERAAYIKARPVAGDRALGDAFLAELVPFIWRKYFDYASIADIHAMKRQIHAVRGHAEIVVPGHDVKLGRGGIREIEFFVQTQQLIFGGRRPGLRGSRTLEMLAELHADGWVGSDALAELSQAYRMLRQTEHRLQMIADEQTQRLPNDPQALAAFARWAGYGSYADFEAAIVHHMRAVERHYARLFEHAPGLDVDAGSLVFAGESPDPETVETLGRLGFTRAREAVEMVRGWHFGRRPAVRSARAREVLTELVPALILAFSGSGDPDAALIAFDAALARMPAAVELFAILRSNAALRELFADILGLAPRLAGVVAQRPHLLDAAIDPATLRGGGEEIEARVAKLDPALPTEEFLDRIRDLCQEEMFLIGVRLLAGTDDPQRAGRNYSDLAAAVVRATLAQTTGAFEREHGRIPGASCAVVAMGKLGSREMTAASDLDLLVIYDFDPERAESDGGRKLDAVRYYTRLTQRLIAALTVATRRGRLYEVDMRLRPSGNQGPLATQFASFMEYQRKGADVWEHMALTRARVIAGDPHLAERVEGAIRNTLLRPRSEEIRVAIAELRSLVAREKGEAEPWDLKLASGGLLDLDFIAQYLVLRHAAEFPNLLAGSTPVVLRNAARHRLVPTETADGLVRAYGLYSDVTQMTRLTMEGRFDLARAGTGLIRRLVAAVNLPDLPTLERELAATRGTVRATFSGLFASGRFNSMGT